MTVAGEQHHDFRQDRGAVKAPTERSFGVTFAVVFALLTAWLLYRHGAGGGSAVTAVLTIVFLAAAFTAPALLRTSN